jgi:hypothetical protein
MNIATEGGHGERVQIKAGAELTVYRNHSCMFSHTTMLRPMRVGTLPDGSELVRADGGPHYYGVESAPGLPSWVSNMTCGLFVRQHEPRCAACVTGLGGEPRPSTRPPDRASDPSTGLALLVCLGNGASVVMITFE